LFGDILAVSRGDLAVIWGGSVLVLIGLIWRWSPLLTATLNEDLATASGIKPKREQLVLTVALALVVAVSIKVVGALLIGAMLVIPAAAVRGLVKTPEAMAIGAVLVGVLATVGGLFASLQWDTPAGPSIVVVAFIVFVASLVMSTDRVKK
jgi:zinc transport system permease protein